MDRYELQQAMIESGLIQIQEEDEYVRAMEDRQYEYMLHHAEMMDAWERYRMESLR